MEKTALRRYLEYKAYQLRRWSLLQTSHAGSGHPTTCLSAADIAAVLFFDVMRFDPSNPDNPDNDRFILSKGHASPLLYAVWKEAGVLNEADLYTYRKIDSVLEGHPTLRFSHSEAATGSLGMGLSIGAGMALNAKLDKRDYRTYVLMGDSEIAEGSVWEAVQVAAYYKLDNLVGIVDVNRLGQSTPTQAGHDLERYAAMFCAFGWQSIMVDGHSIADLQQAFEQAQQVTQKPTVILARTFKGHGVSFLEDKEGFHGVALKKEQLALALASLEQNFPEASSYLGETSFVAHMPKKHPSRENREKGNAPLSYKKGEMVATRKAYGAALAAAGDHDKTIICLDAEVKNSTFAQTFEEKHPDRFIQCFIAEQNMVSMAVGLDRRGKKTFSSTFGAFFTRAHDQIRMAAIGNARLRLVGSHCGVSIGQDGPSQMALEDIALMRGLPDSCVLYPSDAVSTHKLVNEMGRYEKGISYLRTTRAETPVIYDHQEEFVIGGCKIVRTAAQNARACIVGAGITLEQACRAADMLTAKNIMVNVIDLYSVKPLDQETLCRVGAASNNTIITVEDHYVQGGIGEAVTAAVNNAGIRVISLAVKELPRSGKPEELLAWAGIDAHAIVAAVEQL